VEGAVATAGEDRVPIAGEDGMPRAGEDTPDAAMVGERRGCHWWQRRRTWPEHLTQDQPSLVIPCKSRQEGEVGQ
jgi:hypothetical protein